MFTQLDRELEPGRVFRHRRFVLEQHWPIDQLDEYPAVLHGLDRIRDLEGLA
jgi:hypothetical protein